MLLEKTQRKIEKNEFVFLTDLMLEDCWSPKDLDVSSFPKASPLKEGIWCHHETTGGGKNLKNHTRYTSCIPDT